MKTFACVHGITYISNFVFMKDCLLFSKNNVRKWTQKILKSSLHCFIYVV